MPPRGWAAGVFWGAAAVALGATPLAACDPVWLPIARPDMLLGLGWLASGFDPAEMGQVRLSPETAPNYHEEGSDLIWDPNDVRAVVDAFLTRPSEASEAASVQVLNGAGASGLAGQVTIELEQAGFTVLPADNAPADAKKTVVYDVTGVHASGDPLTV